MQGAQDIIDFADGLTWDGTRYIGPARDKWVYVVSQGLSYPQYQHALWGRESAHLTGDSDFSDHWALHAEPIFHTEAGITLDGTVLTAELYFLNNGYYGAPTGHIVSAASPAGPWVIRGSWPEKTYPYTDGHTVSLSQTSVGATEVVRVYNAIDDNNVILADRTNDYVYVE
jgi:hypothetical protein